MKLGCQCAMRNEPKTGCILELSLVGTARCAVCAPSGRNGRTQFACLFPFVPAALPPGTSQRDVPTEIKNSVQMRPRRPGATSHHRRSAGHRFGPGCGIRKMHADTVIGAPFLPHHQGGGNAARAFSPAGKSGVPPRKAGPSAASPHQTAIPRYRLIPG
jgi:hypothetical protein